MRPSKNKGGAPFNPIREKGFKERIQRCQLMDVAAQGTLFTWQKPKLDGYDRIYERLDRLMFKTSWHTTFPEAWVCVLPRTYTDHHPNLLMLKSPLMPLGERPFRFELAR